MAMSFSVSSDLLSLCGSPKLEGNTNTPRSTSFFYDNKIHQTFGEYKTTDCASERSKNPSQCFIFCSSRKKHIVIVSDFTIR